MTQPWLIKCTECPRYHEWCRLRRHCKIKNLPLASVTDEQLVNLDEIEKTVRDVFSEKDA